MSHLCGIKISGYTKIKNTKILSQVPPIIQSPKNQENDPKTGPSPSTQANREEQAGSSEVIQECQRLHHELLQADDETFKENIPQEVGLSEVERQDAQEQDTIPKKPTQEDIIFKECPVGRDLERPHKNRSLINKWVGKIPHPDDNPTYTFIQQIAKPEEYKKLPYMPQLIVGLIRLKIKEVFQAELCKKDQIKSAIVALCRYSITKRKPDDTSELAEVEKYHRGNMRPILLEEDIEEHITKTIGEIDVQIEETLKKGSGYILKRIFEIYIETYTLRRVLGGSYIPTPKKLANTKSTINPDNQGLINPEMNRTSERCLQGALGAYFAHQDGHTDHLERIFRARKYKPYLDIVKLDGIPMPTPICSRIFDKIEKMNPDIFISIWGWNEESATPKPVIASKNFKRKHC
ncbi:hypothetical protein RclHR1_08450005 [Rhizophagus clarus]|uniref:Uncharacterized protein n=1 Tax=Rhizophagus clarus TaxID=94130 RepID=A0A2Z6SN59_9GLOM|nr:hypothetical protein RclHR1_08450005 [Rhizophagus clarus]